MAIYRLSLSTVRRSHGRSAVAAAAYRTGARLYDARTATTHDYRRKDGISRVALVGWAGTREALWQAAEAAERRRDAVVAREVQVALPHELPPAVRWALALSLAEWLQARYGVAVDVALHAPSWRGDDRNHHAHLLFTTRTVTPAGTLGAKTRALDEHRTGRAEVEQLRAVWAQLANEALAAIGRASHRVDHRSYVRRGAVRESEHLGRGAFEHERRGTATEQGNEVRARRRRNRVRAAARSVRGTASPLSIEPPHPLRPRLTR
jgi:hypothetical protein